MCETVPCPLKLVQIQLTRCCFWYKKALVDEYGLRRLTKRRGVCSVDDLYHILFHHWVHDDSVYPDERQRVQVPTGILMASFFGCRPVSMFDTRLRFREDEASTTTDRDKPKDGPGPNPDDREAGSLNEKFEKNDGLGSDMPTLDADSDTDDDNRTCYDSESDSDTDDDIDAGSDQTRTLLWRHVTFFIATNPGLEQPNILFAKVTLVHTKGEDNRLRDLVVTRPRRYQRS